MKKGVLTTVMAFAAALLCCSCGGSGTAEQTAQPEASVQSGEQTEQSDTSSESEEQTEQPNETAESAEAAQNGEDGYAFISEAAAAGTLDAMVQNHGKAAVKIDYTSKDGSTWSEFYYKDTDRYVYEYGDYVYIDENGEVYGFDDGVMLPYKILFAGDGSYEEYRDAVELAQVFQFGESEEIISNKTENGVTVLETSYPIEADPDFYAMAGFSEDEADSYKYVYEFDESTKELKSLKSYIVKDGQDTLAIDMEISFDGDVYVPDEQLVEGVFGDDLRTLTIIADPGTDDEKIYTQTVTKGSAIPIALSSEYDPFIYTDKECTSEMTEDDIDRSTDQTFYIKKAD